MTKLLFTFLLWPAVSFAAYNNYNSILIGEKAAGMGGAYSAIANDPAASSFYNPATLSRMKGSSLSTAVSVYTKSDIRFGNTGGFENAPFEMNQGTFTPIPTASGSVYTFGNFAFGISIVSPDYYSFDGEVESTTEKSNFLHEKDESLWVGGTLALNISPKSSLGLTMYYTSRTFQRINTVKEKLSSGDIIVTNEEKNLTNNSIIYILGYFKELSPLWNLGMSLRLPSLEISGRGAYSQFRLSTVDGLVTDIFESELLSDTNVPQRINIGVSHEYSPRLLLSVELQRFDSTSYYDFENENLPNTIRDFVEHDPLTNIHFGAEYKVKSWLLFRAGLYTNFSSAPDIPNAPTRRYQDKINMWGFSAHYAFLTSKQSSLTLGGFYSGGKGESVQFLGDSYAKINKSIQYFTFLVGTAYDF
jgi:long-subunit fatty acid transport protein